MEIDADSEKNDLLKHRVKNLFQFLFEVNRLRFRPERHLNEQVRVIKVSDLPNHPSIQLIHPITTDDNQSSTEFELRVSRAKITRCPFPPEIIKDWLTLGWDDPANTPKYIPSQNEVDEDGNSHTIFFTADPARVENWERWLKIRSEWVPPEILARSSLTFFQKIYELYSYMENEGERVELMVGDGLLDWIAHSTMETSDVHIHHPILLKKIELLFDPTLPEFRFIDTQRETELYTSCLIDIEGLNVNGINQRQNELSNTSYHPMGLKDTEAYLRALIQTVSPSHGEYLESPPQGQDRYPKLWRDPVIFARRRVIGVTNAISSILDDIDQRIVFPPAFGSITGVTTEKWVGTGFGDVPSSDGIDNTSKLDTITEDEILLAKETNAEQLQIIRQLSSTGGVLVQGPPGTGKTHTIGNIIGHLLAQGKRILVTSHTPKALRVLRSQIPKDLQALCVSVLGSDADARKQLETSISEINARLSQDTMETMNRQIAKRAAERLNILERNRCLTGLLRKSMENEYKVIELNGKSFTPVEAARFVTKHSEQNSWIPGPITWGNAIPISEDELVFLYATNGLFSALEEQDACYALPQMSEILTAAQFKTLIGDINSLVTTDLQFKQDLWRCERSYDSERLALLLDSISKEFSETQRIQTWRPHAIVAGMQGGYQCQVWETLVNKIRTTCELSSQHMLNLHFKASLPKEMTPSKQCDIIIEILTHMEQGGKLGTIQLITKSEWRKFINSSSVVGGSPCRLEHFRALNILVNLTLLRDEIGLLWEQLISKRGGPTFPSLGQEPEHAARTMVEEIKRCLDWHKCTWLPLVNQLRDAGLNIDKVLSTITTNPSLTAEYDIIQMACLEVLPSIIEAQIRRIRLSECEDSLQHYEQLLQKHGDEELNRGGLCQLLSAIKSRNINDYRDAVDYVTRLHAISPIVQKRRVLIERITAVAPAWASAISHRIKQHDKEAAPGEMNSAWLWRQLSEELNRRNELDPQSIQKEIDNNRDILREVTIALIAAKSWARQIERLQQNHSVKQALVGWHDTWKRLKSQQKIDIRTKLLAGARKLMKLSAQAVPVWIMPLAAIAENFDPASTHFDVLIIDEASQADLNALIAMYQADKVIIVGDHEQVTPEAVGKDQSLVHNLIDTYLRDIPNSRLFDNRFSVYDLGRQAFGNAICLVEHFRCVPEIIAFSNKLSYDGRIRPLRESNSTNIKPPCISYRVDGVCQNQTNVKEAETIVNFIRAICIHPSYSDKTIGVISLVGDSQAYIIDKKLRETLDPIDYNKRRIVCGNSANFQGDERDIMFLSVIDSGKDLGEGPITKKGEGAFEAIKKRYNVAASRARDQLWVIHSLDPHDDLKLGDIRRDLILHVQDPTATIRLFEQEEKRTESEFEREVLRILINRGYKVRTQWKVGYYRIDMVIEGNGKRLAVECDGDRWHPIEKLEEDMVRQAILERLGWTFVRIRGSEYYRNPEQTIHRVIERLEELGIHPINDREPIAQLSGSLIEELQAIILSFSQVEKTEENDVDHEESTVSDERQQTAEVNVQQTIIPTIYRNWFDVFDEILKECTSIHYDDFLKKAARNNGYQRLGARVRREVSNAFRKYKRKYPDRNISVVEKSNTLH